MKEGFVKERVIKDRFMEDGFVKVGAASPSLKVADCDYNGEQILDNIKKAAELGVKILIFPELSVSGATCGDLFFQDSLLEGCRNTLIWLLKETKKLDVLFMVGMPYQYKNMLYNTAVFCKNGEVLAVVPKTYIPQGGYEARYFTGYDNKEVGFTDITGQEVPFGSNILLKCDAMEELVLSTEFGTDLWVEDSLLVSRVAEGATVICVPSADYELAGKAAYRKEVVKVQSAKLHTAYIYAGAGKDESTQDMVYGGQRLIAENGKLLTESSLFEDKMIISEIDVKRLVSERRKNPIPYSQSDIFWVHFSLEIENISLSRKFAKLPFVPEDKQKKRERCEEVLMLQAMGLRKRMAHTNCKNAVIGLSGGLDSTLALLVTAKAYDLLGMDRSGILAVTMPGFGTTDRTYQNALKLAALLGATVKEISIVDAVRQHFKDIGQDEQVHDVTYENAQARERTQILMDLANQCNGMVIGTGDLSELALGFATYNGDHMSMYAVNASVPKTLVRFLVDWYANQVDKETEAVLRDILDTPVSPELLPPEENGEVAQKTETIVGPYELHDFFLFYMLRYGYSPSKIFRLAKAVFDSVYDEEIIKKWLKIFYRRFFSQQFKRSCVPDGPKVGTVGLSPRGDLHMPSDACATLWLKEIDELS